MRILVTGGAGYIGSVIVKKLIENKHEVVVLDDLSKGHKAAVHPNATFVESGLKNLKDLDETFKQFNFNAVIHMAAYSLVGESVEKPGKYFRNNVIYGKSLLDAMLKNGCKKIVFSSSAAVFGEPKSVPIKENDPTIPTNPYGESKLMFENIMKWYSKAYGLEYTSLRYFNAAGCDEEYGEHHDPETHLIPIIIQVALGQRDYISIFGNDYPTDDGTCIRDYVHVSDLADAHILALRKNGIYNLGSNEGYSVKDIIEAAREITGHKIPAKESHRRPGDPAVLVADSSKIKKELGWNPQHDLKSIIKSAWLWHQKNPEGYKE
ncbi:MAG: UDP-glucose 4-epimerase GalE [Nanoarchaeota archaeon]|nr:UDP-glucose 4-epimerase GalE [Nanoarchaeota archaeon]MCG2717809.1 UDP-glucose 4-epimerase GalE [Nanoarchaeota archaeon]